MPNSLYKSRFDMHRAPLPHCHDGEGALDCTEVLILKQDRILEGKHLRLFHDDILAPGVSIGVHTHEDDEEYYYILTGQGVMTLDGVRCPVEAGDVTAVYPGGSHGLENTGDVDMRIIVIAVS
jgi:mannose-6-phosphate isomerase-like protein (cupin superfamily)